MMQNYLTHPFIHLCLFYQSIHLLSIYTSAHTPSIHVPRDCETVNACFIMTQFMVACETDRANYTVHQEWRRTVDSCGFCLGFSLILFTVWGVSDSDSKAGKTGSDGDSLSLAAGFRLGGTGKAPFVSRRKTVGKEPQEKRMDQNETDILGHFSVLVSPFPSESWELWVALVQVRLSGIQAQLRLSLQSQSHSGDVYLLQNYKPVFKSFPHL